MLRFAWPFTSHAPGYCPTCQKCTSVPRCQTDRPQLSASEDAGTAADWHPTQSFQVFARFHPLSDPLTTACLLDDLIEEMLTLADLCDARFEWTNSGHRILLLLDECDHLVQQQQFQDALACILQRCSSYSVLLSTHQPMVPAGASKFKVVQHRLQGLLPRDAARLLLRRAQRPLRWGEVQRSIEDPSSLVILNKENESSVLDAVSSQPRVAALKGNPRRLIELANDLDSLTSDV
eukprot:symbB.v1.2.023762.t1/scaffold2144.1/size88043/2